MRSRARREEWVRRVAQWQQSGMSAVAFAATVGVKAGTLQKWKWRLRVTGQREAGSVLGQRAPGFVEVVAPVGLGDRSTESRVLELLFVSGLRVRVPSEFEFNRLRQLVDALSDR